MESGLARLKRTSKFTLFSLIFKVERVVTCTD